jgi:di/tripeptidase
MLAQQVYSIVQAAQRSDLAYEVKIVGNRPTGHISSRHPLVQGALAALEEVGVRGSLERGSTDGNIPLHGGCPTVTIGITRGGNAHRLDEYIEITPVANGLRQLILLALASDQTLSQPEAY